MLSHLFMLFCHSAMDGKVALFTVIELIFIECIFKDFSLFQSIFRLGSCKICNLLLSWEKFSVLPQKEKLLGVSTQIQERNTKLHPAMQQNFILLIRNINNINFPEIIKVLNFYRIAKSSLLIYFPI